MAKTTIEEYKASVRAFFEWLGTQEMKAVFGEGFRTPPSIEIRDMTGYKTDSKRFIGHFVDDSEVKDRIAYIRVATNQEGGMSGVRFENIPNEVNPADFFNSDSDNIHIIYSGEFDPELPKVPRVIYVLKIDNCTSYGYSLNLLVFSVGEISRRARVKCLVNHDTYQALCVAHVALVGLDNIINNEEYSKVFTVESLKSYKSSSSKGYYETPVLKTPINIVKCLVANSISEWEKRDLVGSNMVFEDGVHRVLVN